MAAYNKFNQFVQDVAEKVHNVGSDVLKVMLTDVLPTAVNAVKADITEIAAGNGYAAGGTQATIASHGQVGGTYKLVLNNVVFTAAGGQIGPFRYAVLYNSTPGAGPLIAWFDYGAEVTLNSGETFTVTFDPANGIFTIT